VLALDGLIRPAASLSAALVRVKQLERDRDAAGLIRELGSPNSFTIAQWRRPFAKARHPQWWWRFSQANASPLKQAR
jgi:hypothetical protein